MDRDLIKYLPYEVRKYKDYQVITESENPEFTKIFEVSKKILDESFIESSTEYGVSRLEKILNIYPKSYDTLEDRKVRLLTWWNNQVPYTWRVLIERLNVICGVGNYDIKLLNDTYQIDLKTELNTSSQYEDLLFLFDRIVPVNIEILSSNTLSTKVTKKLYYGTVLGEIKNIGITNDIDENIKVDDSLFIGNIITEYKNVSVTNDIECEYLNSKNLFIGHVISDYKNVSISNDLNKSYKSNDKIITRSMISEYKAVKINMRG